MTEGDYNAKLVELDYLLNDPDVPMQPSRVWALLAELSVEPAAAHATASAVGAAHPTASAGS